MVRWETVSIIWIKPTTDGEQNFWTSRTWERASYEGNNRFLNSAASLLVLPVSLVLSLCASGWAQKPREDSREKGDVEKKWAFGSSQDLVSVLGGLRFENVFKLLFALKPLTVFRIMSGFPVNRFRYLECVMNLNWWYVLNSISGDST